MDPWVDTPFEFGHTIVIHRQNYRDRYKRDYKDIHNRSEEYFYSFRDQADNNGSFTFPGNWDQKGRDTDKSKQ